MQESVAANRPQLVNALGSATDKFKKLPAGTIRTILFAGGVTAGLVLLGLAGRGVMSGRSAVSLQDELDNPKMTSGQEPTKNNAVNVTREAFAETTPGTVQPPSQTRPSVEDSRNLDLEQQNAQRWRSPNEIFEEMRAIDQESSKNIRFVEFQIARKINSNMYQCMITHYPPATERTQIPAIIITSDAEYTSTGKASLLVKYVKEETLETEDGFSKNYIFFEEIVGGHGKIMTRTLRI